MLYYYRKQLIAILLALVLIIAGFVVYAQVTSYQFLTINYAAEEGSMKLYQKPDVKSNQLKEVSEITSGEKMKLKKSSYVIKGSGKDIQPFQETVDLQAEPISETIVFRFSETFLSKKLGDEQPAIAAVIQKTYPKLNSLYKTYSATLYDRGQYYGQVFTYKGKDEDNRDSLRLLAEKKNGQWKILSKPPSLLLSTIEFPGVPQYVLQAIDQPTILPGAQNSPPIDEKNGKEYNY